MKLRPEVELVVLGVSPAGGGAQLNELLDSGELDWEYVAGFAESHRLQQQLCCRLRALRPQKVSPRLDAAFQETLKNSLLLTRELVRILDLLGTHGIDALPFKGPALALKAYGSIAFRSFDDLDILLRVEDVWRARDVLKGAGFQPKLDLNPEREAAYLRAYDEYLLRGPGGFPLVELHWAFVPPHFGVEADFAECWRKREQLKLANRVIPSLDAQDVLLVLSVHGAKHGWAYLGLITDVAWLIANHPMPWESLCERAREMGVLRMLLLAANLASGIFQLELDPAAARAIEADPAVAVLAQEITESIFEINGRTRHDEQSIVRSGLLHMRMRERLRDRVRYFLRLTTRPGVEDWQAIDLPGPLGFLYPVLRFPRLMMKYRSRVP